MRRVVTRGLAGGLVVRALAGALVAACAARAPAVDEPARSESAAKPPRPDAAATIGPPRLVALGCANEHGAEGAEAEGAGAARRFCEGLRQSVSAEGAVIAAADWLPARGRAGVLELPARLGGGVLLVNRQPFQTSLWRAEDFTSAARPLAAVPFSAELVVAGFDRLYLGERSGELVALDPRTGRRLDLGPLPAAVALGSLEFLDERVAAVETELRGVLVTRDAGKTWAPLADPGRSPAVTRRADGAVVIVTAQGDARLTAEGELRPLALEAELERSARALVPAADEEQKPPRARGPLGDSPLRSAVLYGFPDDQGGAYVAVHGSLARVRLADGALLALRRDLFPTGEPCPAVEYGAAVAFVCTDGAGRTRLTALSEGLALREVAVFPEPRAVTGGISGLLVEGPCASAPAAARSGSDAAGEPGTQRFCVVPEQGRGPAWEASVRAGAVPWRGVLVPEGLLLVRPPRTGAPGALRLLSVSTDDAPLPAAGAEPAETPLTLPADPRTRALLETGLWLAGPFLLPAEGAVTPSKATPAAVAPAAVGLWVAGGEEFVGLRISRDGRVTVGAVQTPLSDALLSGPRALLYRPGAVALQTEDGGLSWADTALPPAALEQRPAPDVARGCSRLGCTFGDWLRVGWGPVDAAGPVRAEMPGAAGGAPPQARRWVLDCRFEPSERALGRGAAEREPHAAERSEDAERAESSARAERAERAGRGPRWSTFFGQPPPTTSEEALRLDHRVGGRVQLYGWGPSRGDWVRRGEWLARVFDWFSPGGRVWSSQATASPWRDAVTAAEWLGPEVGGRWSLLWDPGGAAALALAESRAFELAGGAPLTELPLAGALPAPAGSAVRVGDRWILAVQASGAGRLLVVTLGAEGARLAMSLPLPAAARRLRAELVRHVPTGQVGVLVMGLSARGNDRRWALYPLDLAAGRAEAPLAFDAGELSEPPPACAAETDASLDGWLFDVPPPEPPRVEVPSGSVWLNEVSVRGLASRGGLCVQAIGAWGRATRDDASPARAPGPLGGRGFALVVADRLHETSVGLTCVAR